MQLIKTVKKALKDLSLRKGDRARKTSLEESLLIRDWSLWLEAAILALEKSSGNNEVLADQLFTYSLKEVLTREGLVPKEGIVRKEAGKYYRLTEFGQIHIGGEPS